MPFIDRTVQRSIFQSTPRATEFEQTGAHEAFGAAVMHIVDEELQISGVLNREGFDTRAQIIYEKVRDGSIDPDVARSHEIYGSSRVNQTGHAPHYDYAGLAEALNDPDIKTDDVLNAERSAKLKQVREQRQDIIRRSNSPTAAFLGSFVGLLADPINIGSMALTGPLAFARSVGALNRATKTAIAAGATNVGTEALIQPFVFSHKSDIGSPYTVRDAIENIAMAGAGGAGIGFVGGGIAGAFSKYARDMDEAVAKGVVTLTEEEADALATVKDFTKKFDDLEDVKGLSREETVAREKNYLTTLQEQREMLERPSRLPENYAKPTLRIKPGEDLTGGERLKEVIDDWADLKDYGQTMADFETLDSPTVRIGEDNVNAKVLIKDIDAEVEGIDQISRCILNG